MKRRTFVVSSLALAFGVPRRARAIGDATAVELAGLALPGLAEPYADARARLAWAMRIRTSVEVRLDPGTVALSEPALFERPFLWLAGRDGFTQPSDAELAALRRHLELGGFLFIDDASDAAGGFDASVRGLLRRTLPDRPLQRIPSSHTIHHSFYLVERPAGRLEGPSELEGIELDGRMAVVYSRHDLGGAYTRDAAGNYLATPTPGGEDQRERAFRLGVNLVMYALCTDYKDDQVHVPFIMRRRPGQP